MKNPFKYLSQLLDKKKVRRELKAKILVENNLNSRETAKNIAQSMSKSKILYQELASKIHPDRFIDENRKVIANELFQKVENARNSYSKLVELEKEVNEFI